MALVFGCSLWKLKITKVVSPKDSTEPKNHWNEKTGNLSVIHQNSSNSVSMIAEVKGKIQDSMQANFARKKSRKPIEKRRSYLSKKLLFDYGDCAFSVTPRQNGRGVLLGTSSERSVEETVLFFYDLGLCRANGTVKKTCN